jgi:hypothetical protein
MKNKLLILLFLCAGVQLSAQTIVQQFVAVSGPSRVSDMDLPADTSSGSVLIAMPGPLSPSVKVLSVTDNAPGGGNTYKQVPGAASSCTGANMSLDIWYCEDCKPGVNELKFHLSDHVRGSINSFLEVSKMALSPVLDGSGAHVSDGTGTSAGLEVGPSITTTATDFIIARYFSTAHSPTGVIPATWTYKTSYVYVPNASPATYQPTLTDGSPAGSFCMSMAAFKTAAPLANER